MGKAAADPRRDRARRRRARARAGGRARDAARARSLPLTVGHRAEPRARRRRAPSLGPKPAQTRHTPAHTIRSPGVGGGSGWDPQPRPATRNRGSAAVECRHAQVRDLGHRDVARARGVGARHRCGVRARRLRRASTTSPTPTSCSTCSTPETPKAFRRKSRGTYSASFYELPDDARGRAEDELPDARPHARERRRPPCARRGRLVHDDGARHLQGCPTTRPTSSSASRRSPSRSS